jgi:hypothetical protein
MVKLRQNGPVARGEEFVEPCGILFAKVATNH